MAIGAEDSTDDDVGKAGAAGSASAGSGSDGSASYVGGSHNKRRKCPFCSFHGVHLSRHLASIHPDCADSPAERARLVYKVDEEKREKQGNNTTLSNPNERLYQCGMPDCTAIVSRMSQHLRRAHKLTKPGEIAAAKRSFNRLMTKRSNTEESRPSKKAKTNLLVTQKMEVRKSGNTTKAKSKPASSKKKRKQATSEVESDSSDDHSSQIKYDDDFADDSLEESDSWQEDDAELRPQAGIKWADFYRQMKERDSTTRGHFVSCFFRYLIFILFNQISDLQKNAQSEVSLKQSTRLLKNKPPIITLYRNL